jgi:hypothetical protein
MMISVSKFRLSFALVAVIGVAACLDYSRSTEAEPDDIRSFLFAVEGPGGISGVFHEGEAPAGNDIGGQVSAAIPALVLKGGTSQVEFNSATPFSRLVMSVDGVPGYFDLDLPEPTTAATVLLLYAQEVGAPAFWLNYAAGDGGSVGPFATSNIAFLGNSTGKVQVNLTWNSKADIDLYVVDPFGNEIFWNNRGATFVGVPDINNGTGQNFGPVQRSSGGLLDIDSNAGCTSDGPRAENIVWPAGVLPPSGEYTVRVNNWSACGEALTNFVVTIRVEGQPAQIFHGTFDDPGRGGADGAGRRIASFVY